MEWVIFWVLAGGAAAAGSAVLWGRRYFRHEIDRARRIRRANRNSRP
jgi:hypothetical protein